MDNTKPNDLTDAEWAELNPVDPNLECKFRIGEIVYNKKHPEKGDFRIVKIRWDLIDVDGVPPNRRIERWLIGEVARAGDR